MGQDPPSGSELTVAGSLIEEVPIAARALATRLRLESMMRDSSLPDLLDALGGEQGKPKPLEVVEQGVTRSQSLIGRFHLAPDTCLFRSLARYALLRRAGHPVRFVMGLDPTKKSELVGHAWLELDGVPLGEEVDPALAVTFSYPEASS
jgi:hypothetical protein